MDDQPQWTGEIEEKIDSLFEECWDACEAKGVDPELNWTAKVKDGEISQIPNQRWEMVKDTPKREAVRLFAYVEEDGTRATIAYHLLS